MPATGCQLPSPTSQNGDVLELDLAQLGAASRELEHCPSLHDLCLSLDHVPKCQDALDLFHDLCLVESAGQKETDKSSVAKSLVLGVSQACPRARATYSSSCACAKSYVDLADVVLD